MNTTELKRFAQGARRKLLEQVGSKLSFVLTTDSPELREKTKQIKQLREELNKTTKEQLIEKVAYTWFNRLMALRFMDANDYQPLGIRIITPKDGYTSPELLDEAKRGNIPEELPVKRQKIYDLLDSKIPSTNPQNEAFKELLITACNHLHTTFPFLFEKIKDYTELLIPDDLTSDFSIVTDIREGMPINDCKNVEIIGWLYQFYISEKKDEVFASKVAYRKEDIPAATQLFTPRWIVEYMVQNTLGKLWLQNRPNSKLREQMTYFIESPSIKSKDFLKVNSAEELTLCDQACGSGHILVYGFELLTKIYQEEGYNEIEIPQLIFEKNLFGLEIDERASQLAGLALMMKARSYHYTFFKKEIKPNILCYKDLSLSIDEIEDVFNVTGFLPSNELINDLLNMQQATNFGSLIKPHASKSEFERLFLILNEIRNSSDVFLNYKTEELEKAIEQLIFLSNKYNCIVDNPPYMGGGHMNKILADFVKKYYPDSKADLMTCFMESGLFMLQPKGFLGMINLPSWMFLSSFERLRENLIKERFIDSLLHMGRGIFGVDWGSTTFIIWNHILKSETKYFKLHKRNFQHIYSDDIRDIFLKAKNHETVRINFDKYRDEDGVKSVDEIVDNNGEKIIFTANQENFKRIPSNRFGYWLNERVFEIFDKEKVGDIALPQTGLQTSDNTRFVRNWNEVSLRNINFFGTSNDEIIGLKFKWYPYNKGGDYKWAGDRYFIVNWFLNGEEIRAFNSHLNSTRTSSIGIGSTQYFFKSGITTKKISSKDFSARFLPEGYIFDSGGPVFFSNEPKYLLGLFNSKVVTEILKIYSPTLNFQVGELSQIPFINDRQSVIEKIVDECIEISILDWDSRESSWNFMQNELLRINGQDLEESYDLYVRYWENKFHLLHKKEEELNRHFIEIYGLQEELTPDVQLEDIIILNDIINIENGLLVFKSNEVFAQFISFSIGCMFGRYSLDKEGLILANQGETLQYYIQEIGKSTNECSFVPDKDNIIPILDNEWFEDDIVTRFNRFLKVTFGEKNFNKNLAFIEEQIGKDIRKYFIKDFYPEHIKRFKKRPIYWMFSSPKGSFNVLIYIHRYTPDTISNILNKYLKEFIGKLKTRREHLQDLQVSGSSSEKVKAIKETDSIDKILVELQEYERDVLYPLATERIAIDLDDGVLVNYNKFGKAVKEVNGLNDPATKKKVKQFDWIDTTQIR